MVGEDFALWERAIGSLGFPIFVAAYMLIRSDKHVRELAVAIKELTLTLQSGRK